MAANISTISVRNNQRGDKPARGATSRHKLAQNLMSAAVATAYPLTLFAQLPPQGEALMPQVSVEGQGERADGPVQGYRATRSSTFNKIDTPLKDVPASVSVIPSDLMKDQAMQGMGDAFRYVPGVLTHQGEGNRDQIILRGISTTADFYLDGVRDDAQVIRDLYNLERVEVLKGPAGMAFGRGGAGGVVNRVTKRPVFGPVAEASFSTSAYNQRRATLDVGNKINDAFALRFNGMVESSDSFRNEVWLKRYALNPTATYVFGTGTALTVSYEGAYDHRTADRGIPSSFGAPFNTDSRTFFGNAGQSTLRNKVDGVSAVLDHEFDNGWQLKNALHITRYDKFYQNIYPGSAVLANNTLTLAAYNNLNQRQNTFNQTDLTTKFSAFGFEHVFLAGMELGGQVSANKRNTGYFAGNVTAPVVSANTPFGTVLTFRPNGTTDADNRIKADIFAVYTQDQISLSKQWKVLVGLRYDRFAIDFNDRRQAANTPIVNIARTDTGLSPRAGLIWSPTERSTYYASYSYAFLPSAEQLGITVTNAGLAPETAKNYEVGARWDVLPKLTLSAALFRTDRDNVRVADSNNLGFFIPNGQQRTQGVEAGLQGDVTRAWQVYAGAAFLDGRITKDLTSAGTIPGAAGAVIPAGRRLQLVPQRTLSVWNRVNLGDGWAAGLGVIHQSSAFASTGNSVTIPGFVRVDGALYYTLAGGKTRLALNVENLFKKKYYPTVDGDNNISPGAPLNARLTLTTNF